jgi:hypothetical protein
MATIRFRLDRICPVDCTPGAGYRSPEIDEMADIASEIQAMPDDDARPIVLEPATQAVGTLMQCLRRQWGINDSQFKLLNSPVVKATLATSQTDAAAAIDVYKVASHQDLISQQASARSKILRAFQTDALKAAVEKLRPKLDSAADDCVDAFVALGTAVDQANAQFDLPTSLQANVELLDLHRQVNLENEIESWGVDGMTRCLEQIANAIRFANVDVLKNLIPAATRIANKWLSQPPGKNTRDRQRQATHYSTHDPDDAWTRAQKVLRAIADYKESQRPQSIAIAKTSLKRLRPLFTTILGVEIDMATRYHVDGNVGDKGPEWPVDPTWPFRFAPPSPIALPGWSPIEIFTDGRIPIRKPNLLAVDDEPTPRANAEVKNLSGGRDAILGALRGG